jgi:hypothetical protein
MSTTHAICHFCVLSCGVKAEIDDSNGRRELSSLIGDKDDPAFHGYSCSKGRDLPALLRHPDRLLRPLARAPTASSPSARISPSSRRRGNRQSSYCFTLPRANGRLLSGPDPDAYSLQTSCERTKCLRQAMHWVEENREQGPASQTPDASLRSRSRLRGGEGKASHARCRGGSLESMRSSANRKDKPGFRAMSESGMLRNVPSGTRADPVNVFPTGCVLPVRSACFHITR